MNTVAVFCGARPGAHPEFAAAARALGCELAQRGLTLVYGGGHVGLMGILADAVLAAGGRVIGVIPTFMAERELAMAGLTELHIVASMHERKALMAEKAEAFIALPGGLGTLDELFEILTWKQIGLHNKPVALLNTLSYFDPLLSFVNQAVDMHFVHGSDQSNLILDADPSHLLDQMLQQPLGAANAWF